MKSDQKDRAYQTGFGMGREILSTGVTVVVTEGGGGVAGKMLI